MELTEKQQEELFRKQLLTLITLAKKQHNTVTKEQVTNGFSEIELDEGKLALVTQYLENSKIVVVEHEEDLATATVVEEEELDAVDHDFLADYLTDLEGLVDYTKEEKEKIIINAYGGDVLAKEQLLTCFLKEVVEISKLYANQGVLIEDLIGEGNVALTMALDMFECVEHPSEIEGFLTKMIMDAMELSINEQLKEEEQDAILLDKINAITKEAKELSEDLRRKVTIDELSKESAYSKEDMEEIISLTGTQIEYLDLEEK